MASDLERVKFFKEALSSEEIADLQVTEREGAGLYLEEAIGVECVSWQDTSDSILG